MIRSGQASWLLEPYRNQHCDQGPVSVALMAQWGLLVARVAGPPANEPDTTQNKSTYRPGIDPVGERSTKGSLQRL